MNSVVLDSSMARKLNSTPVKLPADVVESGRIVAALSGVTMMDLFADILRPALSEMERKLLAERSRTVGSDAPDAPAKRKGKG